MVSERIMQKYRAIAKKVSTPKYVVCDPYVEVVDHFAGEELFVKIVGVDEQTAVTAYAMFLKDIVDGEDTIEELFYRRLNLFLGAVA